MHILYVDMSGNVGGTDRHFIMAGVAVFETAIHPVMMNIERRLAQVLELPPEDLVDIELHASEIRGGRKRWRNFPKDKRSQVFEQILSLIKEQS